MSRLYCDLCISKDDNIFAVGAELFKINEDGSHEPLKVFSLYIDDSNITNTFQALIQTVCNVIRETPDGADEVLFRSGLPHFHQRQRIFSKTGPIASNHGVKVKLKRVADSRRLAPFIRDYMNDAVNRKTNIIVEV